MHAEILKFRAFDGEKKEMSKPFGLGTYPVFPGDRTKSYWTSLCDIMQFTGMKDKNNKEIWEGDICKRNGHLRVIVFKDASFLAVPTKSWQVEIDIDHIKSLHYGWHLDNFISDIEVIGNVYETPELVFPKVESLQTTPV